MNRLLKGFVVCCLMFQSSLYADTSKTFSYEDQKEEVFNLENFLKEITYIEQEVKGTCTRKVPYQENVCRNVTRYKKECAIVPAHEECEQVNNPICRTESRTERECHDTPSRQECRDVNEYQCRTETRYENECRTVPGEYECRVVVNYREECSEVGGGQTCHTIPGDIECSIVNGENRCVKIPPRQECSNEPSRRECRQVPYEERECSYGSDRQECSQVPRQEQVCGYETRQECSTIPGEEICGYVTREEEVCDDNYETQCRNVPEQEVCKDVPYQEQVCKIETLYRDEEYECMKVIKVPQEKIVKTHKADIAVEFQVLSEILGPEFTFSLNDKGEISTKVTPHYAENRRPEAAVFIKKEVKNNDAAGVNTIKAKYKVLMFNKNVEFEYLQTADNFIGELRKNTFMFNLKGKVDSKRAELTLRITNQKNTEEINKKIAKGNVRYVYNEQTNTTVATVDLKAEGAKIGTIFTPKDKEYYVEVSFLQNYSDMGESALGKAQDYTLKMERRFGLVK